MPLNKISDHNPHLDQMKEQGWAWLHVSIHTGDHGAPHTDDDRAEDAQHRYETFEPQQQEVRIISFE